MSRLIPLLALAIHCFSSFSAMVAQDDFSETHLPQLDFLVQANLKPLGGISCSYVREGQEIQSIFAVFDEPFVRMEVRDKVRENRNWDSVRNSEYYAAVRVDSQKFEKHSVMHLTTNADDGWSTENERTKLPFYLAIMIGTSWIPDMVRSGTYTASTQESNGATSKFVLTAVENVKGPKAVELEFGSDSRFPKSVTHFFDERRSKGSKYTISDFIEIDGINYPTRVQFDVFFDDEKQSTNIGIDYDQMEQLESDRCNLEYYNLAKPGFELANQDNGSLSRILLSASVLFSICGLVWFFLRKSRK